MDVMIAATLNVDGCATGLRVRRATRFWSRAIGLWARSADTAPSALELRPCAAVHTLAMRRSIDVVFVAADGRVLRTVERLAPWRLAACRGATATWELPAGACQDFGVRRGVRLRVAEYGGRCEGNDRSTAGKGAAPHEVRPRPAPRTWAARAAARRAAGVALVEFLLVGVLVLLPLTFATLELAQLMLARNALTYATFEAARVGAVSGASRVRMRTALARGLVPLFAPFDPAAVLQGAPEAVPLGSGAAARALVRATLEVQRPDLTRLYIENPTAAAAADFAAMEDGRRVIPNDGLDARNPFGGNSRQSLRDANILAIRVRYCRRLVMPLISEVIPAVLRWSMLDPVDQICLAQGRVPLDATAVVHMQSAARAEELGAGG